MLKGFRKKRIFRNYRAQNDSNVRLELDKDYLGFNGGLLVFMVHRLIEQNLKCPKRWKLVRVQFGKISEFIIVFILLQVD